MKTPATGGFIVFTCVVLCTLALAAPCAAATRVAGYTFRKIVDTNTVLLSFTNTPPRGSGPIRFGSPSINAAGVVAFRAYYAGVEDSAIFTSTGGPITPIAVWNQGPFAIPDGVLLGVGGLQINAAGTVAFGMQEVNTDNEAIFAGRGGPLTTIVQTNWSGSTTLGSLSMNASGLVAFSTFPLENGARIFTGNGGPITEVFREGRPFGTNYLYQYESIQINDTGTIAFYARLGDEFGVSADRGIFTLKDGVLTKVALMSEFKGPWTETFSWGDFSDPVINAEGTVAFFTDFLYPTLFQGIVAVRDEVIRIVAQPYSAGSFVRGSIGEPHAINASGTVLFGAGYGFEAVEPYLKGLFTSRDGAVARVIGARHPSLGFGPGDALFGSRVIELGEGLASMNDLGEVAFVYTLLDGQHGIAVASPFEKEVGGDLLIKEAARPDSDLALDKVFQEIPFGRQLRQFSFEPQPGSVAAFDVEFQNDATETVAYVLTGSEGGDEGWKLEAIIGGVDRWNEFLALGFLTGPMTPGAKLRFQVRLSGTNNAVALPNGTKHEFRIASAAANDPAFIHDGVRAQVETVTALIVNSTGDEEDADPFDDVADVDLDKPGQQVTLRAAIQTANNRPGKDIIKFQIPEDDPGFADGVWLIKPETPLPRISDSLIIDGWSQDPNSATPRIELSGDSLAMQAPGNIIDNPPGKVVYDNLLQADGFPSGIVIDAGDCEVRGLAINHFPLAGMMLHGPYNVVQGVFFGTDPTGTIPRANGSINVSTRGCDLAVLSAGNQIGGPGRNRNLFCGTGGVRAAGGTPFSNARIPETRLTGPGVIVQGSPASGNRIEGNLFGLDPSGSYAVFPPGPLDLDPGNRLEPDAGVLINRASGNVIGGTDPDAVNFFGGQVWAVVIAGAGATENRVVGNVIGLNENRTLLLGVGIGDSGVKVTGGAGRNFVGGPNAGEGNLIAPGGDFGVLVEGHEGNVEEGEVNEAPVTEGVVIEGNQIGKDRPGGVGPEEGIHLEADSSKITVRNNTILFSWRYGIHTSGSDSLILLNRIVGGLEGILILGGGGSNQVFGNEISKTLERGMQISSSPSNQISVNQIHHGNGAGIVIRASSATQITANSIHHNNGPGVLLETDMYSFLPTTLGNQILQNEMHDNLMGISLGDPSTPTPNDVGDLDSGANTKLNFPGLLNPRVLPNGFHVNGSLDTQAGRRVYRIEFFANGSTPNGYGEGERFLGAMDATTDLGGLASFLFETTALVTAGEFITATATDADGNTSEFSAAVMAESGFDRDSDGIDDALEERVPNRGGGNFQFHAQHGLAAAGVGATGDGNGDGIADSQQGNVASFIGIAGTWLTLSAASGVTLQNVEPGGPPNFRQLPAGYTFPAGFVSFTATGIALGDTVTITNIFHEPFAYSTVFAYGPTPGNPQPHWYEFLFDGVSGATLAAEQMVLTFRDGARGDHDLQMNSSITTILAAAYLVPPGPALRLLSNSVSLVDVVSFTVISNAAVVVTNYAVPQVTSALAWPAAGTNYLLEFTDTLGRRDLWQPVFADPVNAGGQNVQTNTSIRPSLFYRLRRFQ